MWQKFNVENAEPSRKKERIETADPRATKLTIDTSDINLAFGPAIDKEDPSLTKLLKLTEDPMEQASSTESAEPTLAKLLTDSELPKCA